MNNQKQEQAKTLYFQTDLSKTQIAEALNVPRRTLHHWIRQYNWDVQKDSASVMPSFLAGNCYHVINRFTQQLLSAETITHKDAEALHKFTITVNKLKNRTTLSAYMEIFGRFIDSVNAQSPEVAQVIAPIVEDYLGSQSGTRSTRFQPVPNTANQEEDPKESELDQQDIRVWEQENNPLDVNGQTRPHTA